MQASSGIDITHTAAVAATVGQKIREKKRRRDLENMSDEDKNV